MEDADFSGYATRNGLLCSDGRTIEADAFAHQDKQKIPLMWQHRHNEPANVLGHAYLENREDGVYTYGFFNDTDSGKMAKQLLEHGDVNALSIFANGLKHKGHNVVHGDIKEVSLVLSPANPGALIDYVSLAHGEDSESTEAEIFTGLTFDDEINSINHSATTGDSPVATATDNKPDTNEEDETIQDVLDTLNEKQTDVVNYLVGEALAENKNNENKDTVEHGDVLAHIDSQIKEGFNSIMTGNVFENAAPAAVNKPTLTHSQIREIVADAREIGSLKKAFEKHLPDMLQHDGVSGVDYGIKDIDLLFPDAKSNADDPQFLSRQMEWVTVVLNGTRHTPFSRVRSTVADITADEARARGYITGNLKKEEVIKLLRRKTEPTTIYKKQKLDRDDVLDITDLDVVAFLKSEMRLMLNEELARAILLGDGRLESSDDKIDEERIRPIAKDVDLYALKTTLASNLSVEDTIDELIRARSGYRGSGQPVFFTTLPFLTDMLLHKDKVGRRVYDSITALQSALMVSQIVTVEVMEQEEEVVGIFVNLADYSIGADKGGELSMFDDFDIDYNQMKYLMETRVSGALTKPKSAIVVKRAAGTPATPVSPNFNGATNTITIPTTTGIDYQIDGETKTGSIVITKDTQVDAKAKDGYTIPTGTVTHWTFVHTAA